MISLIHPVAGSRISSQFGVDRGSHTHGGVDFAAACGTPVYAAAAGRVSAANYSTSAGNLVHIEHGGGLQTRYFHLQRSVVGVGVQVAQGQLVGHVGNTGKSSGCHLHFETRINGAAVDPVYALQSGAGAQPQGGAIPQLDMSMLPGGDSLFESGNAPFIAAVFALLLIVVAARR
jgi:murein DD-endopeptidase MepM/ murein hydrolase activator NlpD